MRPSRDVAETSAEAKREQVLHQIGHCLRQGCVICIQHARELSPHYTKWEVWGTPRCYSGDPQRLYGEIDRCRVEHADHHIRLDIEDYSCHSRFSFVVHRPQPA
jgi:ribulose-bisphosphate carboxylase small chain